MSELQQVTGSDSSSLKARALSSVTGPLQWQPGDKYAYGNQGMNIAARIVEIVSGMPYEEFLQKRLFDPLGMTETPSGLAPPKLPAWPAPMGLIKRRTAMPEVESAFSQSLTAIACTVFPKPLEVYSPPRTTFCATVSCWPTTANGRQALPLACSNG